MSPQTARVLEGLGASVTGVWAFSSVLAQVILVVRAPLKGEGAIGAQEGSHTGVDTLVDLETKRQSCETSQNETCLLVRELTCSWLDISPGAEKSV